MIVVAKINGEKVEKTFDEFVHDTYNPNEDHYVNFHGIYYFWEAAKEFLRTTPEAKESDIFAVYEQLFEEYTDEYGDIVQDYKKPCGRKLLWGGYENGNNSVDVYLNVYEYGRNYGGPEEGGWWYDTWSPMKEFCQKIRHTGPVTDNLAELYNDKRNKLLEEVEGDIGPHRSASSAAGGFDVRVRIEFEEADNGNNYKPWC